MSRSTAGWVKFHRSVFEKDIGQNSALFLIWMWLLGHANYKESQIIWKGKQRVLQPGQLLVTIREIANHWGLSGKTVHKWLTFLSDTGRLGNETGTHGTIVTICNWKEYQNFADDGVTPREHEGNTEVTPGKLYKESKKERRKNRESTSLPPLAEIWNEYSHPSLARIIRVDPSGKRGRALSARWQKEPDKDFWVRLIQKINESHFCLGGNDRQWKADIDFLLAADTPAKILEGKYNNKTQTNGHAPALSDEEKRLRGFVYNEGKLQ